VGIRLSCVPGDNCTAASLLSRIKEGGPEVELGPAGAGKNVMAPVSRWSFTSTTLASGSLGRAPTEIGDRHQSTADA
jgi:hypothetical protein